MPVQIALLRGINVGSRRRVSMADLRSLLTERGHQGARTYLQSGNVVLASDQPSGELARDLELLIGARFGIEVPVIVRTREDLSEVVAHDPLAEVADDARRRQVSFLSAEPAESVVRAISEVDVAPEIVIFSGREIHTWHPGGVHSSRLARLLTDRRLGVTATARNWQTVTALLAMAREA